MSLKFQNTLNTDSVSQQLETGHWHPVMCDIGGLEDPTTIHTSSTHILEIYFLTTPW